MAALFSTFRGIPLKVYCRLASAGQRQGRADQGDMIDYHPNTEPAPSMNVTISYAYTSEAEPAAVEWNQRKFDKWPAPSLDVIPLPGDSIRFGAEAPTFDVIHRTFTWIELDHLQVDLLLGVPNQQKKSAADT